MTVDFPAGTMVPDVSVNDLSAMIDGGRAPLVLDVREPWEIALCVIPGSVTAPMSALPASVEGLPEDRAIVVVCHHGMRSAQVAQWLSANGYDQVYNLAGGIDAWAREIDPSMRRY